MVKWYASTMRNYTATVPNESVWFCLFLDLVLVVVVSSSEVFCCCTGCFIRLVLLSLKTNRFKILKKVFIFLYVLSVFCFVFTYIRCVCACMCVCALRLGVLLATLLASLLRVFHDLASTTFTSCNQSYLPWRLTFTSRRPREGWCSRAFPSSAGATWP